MFFDSNLAFYGTAPYASLSNYTSLAGVTTSTASPLTVDMTVPEDLGIGSGEATPKLALYVGAAITSSCASLSINVQFRGSTDSTHWTVYAESGALSQSALIAGAKIFPIDVPHRPAGAALPRYYDINLAVAGNLAAESISTGSLLGGIVIDRTDNPVGQYPSGYTFPSGT